MATSDHIEYIPKRLWPHFQEYDPSSLNLEKDANLIMQRTLEFGNWDEMRWLFKTYGEQRVKTFIRDYGERMLSAVTFNYWRKLLGLKEWRCSPFPTGKGELWDR